MSWWVLCVERFRAAPIGLYQAAPRAGGCYVWSQSRALLLCGDGVDTGIPQSTWKPTQRQSARWQSGGLQVDLRRLGLFFHCVPVAGTLCLHYCAALSLQAMCLEAEIHWLQTLKHSTSCA